MTQKESLNDRPSPQSSPQEFADQVMAWQRQYGRSNLPWQLEKTPYTVWISEIMLQQTQVSTVLPYFKKFFKRFPTIQSLADASLDEVLYIWTGLGYYARARNLHKAAQRIMEEFSGCFPKTFEEVLSLPGIGRTTAGAILSLSQGLRFPILDGNVKRILTRYFSNEYRDRETLSQRSLWTRAEQLLPETSTEVFNQGMMDLGALICRIRTPLCHRCPLNLKCQFYQSGAQSISPSPRRTLSKKSVHWWVLIAVRPAQVWLMPAPKACGIWQHLHVGRLFDSEEACLEWLKQQENLSEVKSLPELIHRCTHLRVHLHPIYVVVHPSCNESGPGEIGQWYTTDSLSRIGVPAPMKYLLSQYAPEVAATAWEDKNHPRG